MITQSSERLRNIINNAIQNQKITFKEYETIYNQVYEDGYIDIQEKALLSQLHNLIDNGTIERVPS